MAAKSAWLKNSILLALFNGQAIAGFTSNDPATTSLYIALHTASPGADGTATTNETTFTGYARQPLLRTAAGWVVTNDSVSPAETVEFGEASGLTGTVNITHISVTTAATGASNILYFGALDEVLAVSNGTIPRLTTASYIREE